MNTHLTFASQSKKPDWRHAWRNLVSLLLMSAPMATSQAATVLWSAPGSSAWLTDGNWTGGTAPSTTDAAQFGVNPTSAATGVGINMNGTTNNGSKNHAVGAIEVTSDRTNNLFIGNSSSAAAGAGTLTLNGATVNSVNNVVLRNNSAGTLTLQNTQGSGNKTMDVALGNATNNVVAIDGAGGIAVSSIIKDGAGNSLTLQASGSGKLTLSGANTYTGTTTINSGTLQLGASNVLADASAVALNGGTLAVSATGGFSDTVGSLSVLSSSVIDMGTNAAGSVLTFAGIASGWTGTLSIYNWTGTLNTPGGTDRLLFTSTATAPGSVQFFSGAGAGAIGSGGAFSGGELVPVPEPGAVLAGLLLVAPIAWRERRHFLRCRAAT